MTAIYKKELRAYFTSVTGYIVIAAMLMFIGIYFTANNLNYGRPSFAYALVSVALIIIIAVPLLTMRSFAEERKSRTDQLLLTAPVSVASIVVAKWLSMMTVLAVPMGVSCICPLIMLTTGAGTPLVDYSTIFAFYCMCGVYVAIGELISSITENQIVAAVLTFVALLVLYLWDSLVGFIPGSAMASYVCLLVLVAIICIVAYSYSKNALATVIIGFAGVAASTVLYFVMGSKMESMVPNVLANFSMMAPLYNFAYYSIFDLRGIILYLSLAALFLVMTMQTVQKRRWS